MWSGHPPVLLTHTCSECVFKSPASQPPLVSLSPPSLRRSTSKHRPRLRTGGTGKRSTSTGTPQSLGVGDGDRLIAGDYGESGSATQVNGPVDDLSPNQGAGYIFEYQGGSWTQTAYLKASNGEAGDRFGSSVAIDGDWVVVGATGEFGPANPYDSAGAAYVFRRNAIGNWQERAILRHPEPTPIDYFGTSCAIDGNNTGAVFVFDRTGAQWNQTGVSTTDGLRVMFCP